MEFGVGAHTPVFTYDFMIYFILGHEFSNFSLSYKGAFRSYQALNKNTQGQKYKDFYGIYHELDIKIIKQNKQQLAALWLLNDFLTSIGFSVLTIKNAKMPF